MVYKINLKVGVPLVVFIVVMMQPAYFTTIFFIDKVFEMLKILITGYVLVRYFYEIKAFSISSLLCFLYEGIVLFSTIINGGILKDAILEMVYVINFCLITHIMLKNHMKLYLQIIYYVLELYAIINLVSVFLFPDGMFINDNNFICYFLGYRNTAYQYLLPMVIYSAIYSILVKDKIRIRVYMDIFICLLFVILTNSVTGILLFSVILIGYLLVRVFQYVKMLWIMLGGVVCTYLLAIIRIQDQLTFLFEEKFNRSITLSGRTILWDILLKYIERKPYLGWGLLDMSSLTNIYWAGQAHNQYIQVLFQCGIIGICMFLFVLFFHAVEFDKKDKGIFTGIFSVSMIAYVISFQTEGYVQPIFFAILTLMINSEVLVKVIKQRAQNTRY